MCGIAGVITTNRINSSVIEKMTNSMPHRGPDAAGFYGNEAGTAFLGHRRLSIIDLSTAANQPMYSHCGKYVMVFNGEIFNFQQIAKELHITFKTHSDTEVILEAFVKWGPSFVNRLNGMFAIAIYAIYEDKLYLFRDRLGVKPIYYAQIDQQFYFGSELKDIQTAIPFNQEVDNVAVYYFLHLGYIPEPLTIFKSVHKFPSGAYAVYSKNGLKFETYWRSEDKIESAPMKDFDRAKSAFKELFVDAVKYRMIADVPFGTFLSGGVDSSLVTAAAQSVSASPVKTFSIGIKDAQYNESAYSRKIAEYLKTEHYEFIVTEQDALDLVDQISTAYDEPFADSSAIPTMLVSKLARQHVTMTLSGDGGDELFQGYGMYKWAMRLQNPLLQMNRNWLATVLKGLPERYQRAADVIRFPDLATLPTHIFSQEQYMFSDQELRTLLHRPMPCPNLLESTYTTKRTLNAAESQALFDLHYYLKDDLLAKVDRASMQFSLETRTPFLDYRVVEFALNLPYEFKVKNGVTKFLLKEVLYDFVPESYFDRPKWGFSIPLVRWLNTDLKPMVESCLTEEHVNAAGMVNWEDVKRLKNQYYGGKSYLYNRIWALTQLHKWYIHNCKNN